MGELSVVATCALGLEEILAKEVRELGLEPTPGRGAVTSVARWPDVWRANLRLRTANRVLVELGRWPADDEEGLSAGVERLMRSRAVAGGLPVAELLHPRRTLAVRASSSRSRMRDTRWVALKIKDTLVDTQRASSGLRSSVDRRSPDVPLRAWLHEDRLTLLLDTSREPLDRRGYRVATTQAPVREQLAAACVLASGWNRQGPVVDPMCGSGTLLIEAGWHALGIAPGSLRERWVFERWPGFDRDLFDRLRREPDPEAPETVALHGVERAPDAIAAARANAAAARLAIRIERGDAFAFRPPAEPGLVAINPPYGQRVAENRAQWRRLGDLLKQRYKGWKAVILAGDADRGKHIGLRPSRRLPVRNGPIDARILTFDLY
jgi:putative N6-adenine-specific DNA methylase